MRIRVSAIACFLGIALLSPNMFAQDVVWAKRMGGTDSVVGVSIAVDTSGNTYVTGYFSGTAAFGAFNLTSAGVSDVFVEKLDNAGTVLWAKRMGGTDFDEGTSIAVDGSGNTYVTGEFSGAVAFGAYNLASFGAYDVFVEKLDNTGTVQWAKHMGAGTDYAEGLGVAVDGSGNTYVTGYFGGTAAFGAYNLTSAGAVDAFLEKLDSTGNVQWAKQVGGTCGANGYGIAVDRSGNTYVTGYFCGTGAFGTYNLTSVGSYDVFVAKLDSGGTVQWARQMGGATADGIGIAVDGNGNTYVTGDFSGTGAFGAYNLASAGASDIFVEKLDNAGTVLWAQRMGGTGDEGGHGVVVGSSGNTYVTGGFSSTGAFGVYSLTSAGAYDVFVEKLDSGGTVQWAKRMGGMGDDAGSGVVVDTSGNTYVTGKFSGTAAFGAFNLTSAGVSDVFVEKLGVCGPLFVKDPSYGSLLFQPLCTTDASGLTQNVYNSTSMGLLRATNDRFLLSSQGTQFSPLVVADAVHINGVDGGLGPYSPQPGVPPYVYNAPIDGNLVPLPACDITTLIPVGESSVLFELLDTQRLIYGNTPVYLVQDCGLWLSGHSPTVINYVTHDDQVAGLAPQFDVRYGLLSQLRADRNFSRASCLGHFFNTPETEALPNPAAGDGYYYLARGLSSCVAQGYGDSTIAPDPRDALDALPTCP